MDDVKLTVNQRIKHRNCHLNFYTGLPENNFLWKNYKYVQNPYFKLRRIHYCRWDSGTKISTKYSKYIQNLKNNYFKSRITYITVVWV